LTLRNDGSMTVERGGARGTAFVPAAGLTTLHQTFAAAGYFALPAEFGGADRAALASVTYANNGVAKGVVIRDGAPVPPSLLMVQGMLDNLVAAVTRA
jgi:hypothetical protein